MSTVSVRGLTPKEYLEIERKAERKSEYHKGEMVLMAGVTRRHNVVAVNFTSALNQQLLDRPCEVYQSDMRTVVDETGLYTYPDVIVTCGEPRFLDNHFDTLMNPVVIVEVLSDSTEAYDRGKKFAHYRQIKSLREYVLVSQNEMRVDRFLRQNDEWLLTSLEKPEDRLDLPSIECSIALAEIYRKIDFSQETA